MAIETIRVFSADNLTNGSGGQAINPSDTNGVLVGSGDFMIGGALGEMIEINDTDTGTTGDTAASFDDGTGANQVLNEDVTLTYNDGTSTVTNVFPAGTQVQAEFTVTFSSGYSIIGIRLENPVGSGLVTAGYTIVDSAGNPAVPPPGTNLGTVVATGNDGTSSYANVVCFTQGCMIQTPTGPRRVEDLLPGDVVMTADNGPQPLIWTGRRHLDATTLALLSRLRPIRIKAGALAPSIPAHDLVVSPQHRILVRSKIAIRMFDTTEVFVAAKHLLALDGVSIARDMTSVTYIHIMCRNHEIIDAEGALAETLYTGTQAIQTMTDDARAEIDTLFGGSAYLDRPLARPTPRGRQARHLVQRHAKNRKSLYQHSI